MAVGQFGDFADLVEHVLDEGLELLQAGLRFRGGPVFSPAEQFVRRDSERPAQGLQQGNVETLTAGLDVGEAGAGDVEPAPLEDGHQIRLRQIELVAVSDDVRAD